eukprot:TRINITY_DN1480_c0_g1_i1.p1 TRINITY_DN1480_c0_g1~~TRINITY_DN1480_c0_g1_i1.p1  ORF type:complete len:629 (+),score=88.00 TRINITY_DN1480_c0_g1_i1:331-2217(+)
MDDARRMNLYPNNSIEIYDVGTLALIIWRDRLFSKIKFNMIRAILEVVKRDRDGEKVNQSEIYGIMTSYVKIGSTSKTKPLAVYKEEFETPFFKDTKEYYSMESSIFLAHSSVSEYMIKVEERLEEEKKRSKVFLNSSSGDQLRKEVEMAMIDSHKDRIQSECNNYLKEEKILDLGRMYRLFSRIDNGVKPMLEVLQNFIVSSGFESIKRIPEKDQKDPKTYVETLLNVYHHFSQIVKNAFNDDSQFVAALDKACRKIVNENSLNKSSVSPEYLAKYCDLMLKKSSKNLEDNELDEKLNQIIMIFKYVDDKDVFQKFYSKMLARRLIQGISASDDAESQMIGRLKAACGFEYTSKLQRMFTDMNLSVDMNEKFRDYIVTNKLDLGKVDFNIQVLTAGSWPLQTQASNFNVPQELEKCINQFQSWYSSRHQGRKLAWLHHLSKGDIRTNCLKKRYEFQVTNYQMAILLLFNTSESTSLGYDTFLNSINLKEAELKRSLESLIEANVLVVSEGQGSELASQSFQINYEYSNKRLKIKLASALQKESKSENDATHKGIEDDRKLYLQAAIVRIMKSRKSMTHLNLVQEVIVQSRNRFQPNVQMIKKCVEHLIEKEYLQRADGETDKYNYVA